ncbi:MAG TPA: hypothetical protein VEW69_01275 [Alphaproteobacteria bacterium]|nr:hypothetical protein [Alphaproteobacteria bacterium]
MSETSQSDGGSNVVRYILVATAAIYMVGSLVFMVQTHSRVNELEQKQMAALEANKKLTDAAGQNRASIEALRENTSMTKQELSKRAAVLQQQEQATQTRLSADEEATKKQFTAVAGEVSGVKSDVGKVQTDVSETKTDLATTKSKLERAIGDLNKHSELIATTHDELELLKHRGDRNYYEFTLNKNQSPTRLSTVSLQLKKTDPKHNKFTLYVLADDRQIEKKDRSINEPLQFYTGKDHNLFEVVINSVDKNNVTGYMSTPKTGPAPTAEAKTQ